MQHVYMFVRNMLGLVWGGVVVLSWFYCVQHDLFESYHAHTLSQRYLRLSVFASEIEKASQDQ